MSTKFPGGIITKSYTPPTTTSASGIWTLDQQDQAQQAGIWPFGGPFNYIEDVFSTYLYTGTGAAQTITNNIDLSTKGGLVWLKSRSTTYNNYLQDTTRGIQNSLVSNDTSAQSVGNDIVDSVSTSGFVVQSYSGGNNSGSTYASWTFRKQPKFFDVVTWTGNGSNPRNITHNLGSVPGCMIIKCTSNTGGWFVYHSTLGNTKSLNLNETGVPETGTAIWGSTTPTSAVFTVGNINANTSGYTYVAYLFASNAGGFGLTGTDNVISCGSYVGTGAVGNAVTLGYEPQWLMVKDITAAGDWIIYDNMRGMPASATNTGNTKFLKPNLTNAEAGGNTIAPTATGFEINTSASVVNTTSDTYIYIAIRRGPMKVPTDATTVFTVGARTGTSAVATVNAGFPQDSWLVKNRDGNADTVDWSFNFFDRLRSSTGYRLSTAFTDGEDTSINFITSYNQNSITLPSTGYTATNGSGYNYIDYFLRRAPSFFDEVCYTGTGSTTTQTHNLGAVPELMIIKRRTNNDGAGYWAVYSATTGNTKFLTLNATSAENTNSTFWNNTSPTSSVFTVGTITRVNGSAETYVAYLFATCAGVSKVGSYTGNGSTQAIACGFSGGARFVLIKRTDSTGGWYVYDTARGMTTLTDPYLFLNSTAAESATLGSVTTTTGGFTVNATILSAINTSSATYIFLAIA